MIPIRDSAPRLRKPVVVYLLIVANAVVFALQYGLPAEEVLTGFGRFGVVPAAFLDEWGAVAADPGLLAAAPGDFLRVAVLPLFTWMFLHAGPLHLLGNMLFLWIFGDNVEGRLGWWRFLAFYVLAGLAAVLVHCFMEPASTMPIVGASGAVSGILGAYLLLYPRERVVMLVPIFVFLTFVEVPAWILLPVWFALQIPDVQGVLGWLAVSGVAWWAHVGGFVAGMALLPLCLVLNPKPQRVSAYS